MENKKKVIIIASARKPIVQDTIEWIKQHNGKCEIYLLVQSSRANDFKDIAQNLILLPDGPFSIRKIGIHTLKEIRNLKANLFVIVWYNLDGKKYLNVELIALASGSKKIICRNIEGEIFEFNFFSKYFKKLIRFSVFAIFLVLLIISIPFLFLFLKLKKNFKKNNINN